MTPARTIAAVAVPVPMGLRQGSSSPLPLKICFVVNEAGDRR